MFSLSTRLSSSCFKQQTICPVLSRFFNKSSTEQVGRNKHRERVYLNEVRLLGRVGSEPIVRGEQSQVAVFPVATSMFWTSASGQKERVDWHRIVVGLPSLRERVLKTVTRGDRVMVLGSVQYKEYVDHLGNRHNTTFIAAARILNLTNKLRAKESAAAEETNEEGDEESADMYEDDAYKESSDAESSEAGTRV